MAVSISRPDPTSPASVAEAKFSTARRGYDQDEVRELLRSVAAELRRLQEREVDLERELRIAQSRAVDGTEGLDDETVARVLGEETLHVLQTARESASQIKIRAEEGAARILREATEDANRTRASRPRSRPRASAPMPPPTPRARCHSPSSRAARWSTRHAPTASGCCRS